MSTPAPPPSRPERPWTLRCLVGGTLLEGVGLAVGAVVVLVELVRGKSDAAGTSIALVVLALALAALLGVAGRALHSGARWARSPVATWQILQALVGVTWWQETRSPWAGVLVLVSVVLLVLLMVPSVVALTTDRAPRDGDS
ncbi:hypothetical protein GCM10023221_13940 [Luteimicrobium xylanilyticum]|uniref:Uncharacterized protein n=1 Tax=Luteimicrobium xylanilyticum TaxID=1133546 RepID=A0A5P9QCG6_9MICO|nr:hypothetical protein [Luteimicrobium xylanilyticum]QFU99134.1 hypothetical protein KDY119_02660 [Luteimicrobium xylanilyticum]